LQGPCECSRGHESASRGRKGANKGHESAHSDRGAQRGCESIQNSHSLEKVLVDSLLQAERVLVDCRGLESALEAVRVSVEGLRVSIEPLRCLRGCERLEEVPENVNRGRESVAEAKKVPIEVVREPVRKSV
jgi:hypothetical protein